MNKAQDTPKNTPRVDAVESGPYPIRAMPHLARDLERELTEVKEQRDAARKNAELSQNMLDCYKEQVRELHAAQPRKLWRRLIATMQHRDLVLEMNAKNWATIRDLQSNLAAHTAQVAHA